MDMDVIARKYDQRCEQHGDCGWLAGHWETEEEQLGRWERMQKMICFVPGHTLLDVGCGQGDLFNFIIPYAAQYGDYTGLDVSPKMIEIAQKKHPQQTFVCDDFLEHEFDHRFDHVFACGLLTFKPDGVSSWDYLTAAVRKMYDLCNEYVVFNCLSLLHPENFLSLPDYDDYYWASPSKTLDYCLSITPFVKFHNYLNYEFAISLRKEADAK